MCKATAAAAIIRCCLTSGHSRVGIAEKKMMSNDDRTKKKYWESKKNDYCLDEEI